VNLFPARCNSELEKLGVLESVMNNASIFTADRTTHLKIVVAALICSTVVAGIGIAARMTDGPTSGSRLEASVIRAGTPVTASNGGIVIR
jgi:ABC-type proline/glycine betaine transport system permease subunit